MALFISHGFIFVETEAAPPIGEVYYMALTLFLKFELPGWSGIFIPTLSRLFVIGIGIGLF